MSGGPETIRAKVEARKAELRDLANAEQARVQAEQKRKTEAAKKEAEARLAKLESDAAAATPVSTSVVEATAPSRAARSPRGGAAQLKPDINPPTSTQARTFVDEALLRAGNQPVGPDAVDEKLVDAEFESLVKRKANERWTSSENTTFLLTLVGGFIFLFIHWPLGLGSIGFSILYAWAKQRHYGGQVRQELGLPPR